MLRNLRRTNPSSLGNVVRQLCLKYSNQPRSVRFTSAMIWVMLCPEVRLVFARIVSLSFLRLLVRGQRLPASKW
jgi:hypothetical protein